ncbi:hypothetical protein [Rhizobium laguerreae]
MTIYRCAALQQPSITALQAFTAFTAITADDNAELLRESDMNPQKRRARRQNLKSRNA